MTIHKLIAKLAMLKLMRAVESRCDYYLTRSNPFYPLVNPIVGIRSPQPCVLKSKEAWAYGVDKVQYGITQLISREVYRHKIKGAIAELGVFRGFNASVMNYFFPDRKLYLFDTFSGFDPRDLTAEKKLGYSIEDYHNFSNTSVDVVMEKMFHKNNVVIKKGWFPQAAVGLEDETFCFVVLDADLYQPTYEGLRWFYPRLAKGGYIVVDDVNWDDYPGARKAVEEFSKQVGVSYIPIPNATGGVVIGKPWVRKE